MMELISKLRLQKSPDKPQSPTSISRRSISEETQIFKPERLSFLLF
ncbi:hypothetical protein DH86_00000562 [Scytalidium sp. 3C]|nr:hypothetical protein DH86_00000562 [Scytalidium sp. 3C]